MEVDVRRLIYPMMISLDGYVSRPDGALDWVTIDEELHTFINDLHRREISTYLSGRRTYEMMAAAWPRVEEDPEAPAYMVDFSRIWQAKPKVVFSSTLERVEWNARLVREDAAAEINSLKCQSDGDMLIGGPTIAASFVKLGLIDVVDLFVNPVVLGSGVPLFPGLDGSLNLQLADSRAFDSGIVYLRYRLLHNGR